MISPVLHQILSHCRTLTVTLVFTPQIQSSYKIKGDDFSKVLLSLPLGPLKFACHKELCLDGSIQYVKHFGAYLSAVLIIYQNCNGPNNLSQIELPHVGCHWHFFNPASNGPGHGPLLHWHLQVV